MSREIFFSKKGNPDWNYNVTIPFGLYSFVLFYASQNNSNGGELLFKGSISKWKYRHIHNLPKNGFSVTDYDAYYEPNELQPLIDYLNNQLIPALTNENEADISELYGGLDNYYNLFNNSTNYVGEFGLFESELYGYYVSQVIDAVVELRDFFQRIKDNSFQYEISID